VLVNARLHASIIAACPPSVEHIGGTEAAAKMPRYQLHIVAELR
jgi:hypothetical protein